MKVLNRRQILTYSGAGAAVAAAGGIGWKELADRTRTDPLQPGTGHPAPAEHLRTRWAPTEGDRPARRHDRRHHGRHPQTYLRMLTARAMTRAAMTSETRAWTSMVSFAHRVNGMVSVGLNAVALVNDRYR